MLLYMKPVKSSLVMDSLKFMNILELQGRFKELKTNWAFRTVTEFNVKLNQSNVNMTWI